MRKQIQIPRRGWNERSSELGSFAKNVEQPAELRLQSRRAGVSGHTYKFGHRRCRLPNKEDSVGYCRDDEGIPRRSNESVSTWTWWAQSPPRCPCPRAPC